MITYKEAHKYFEYKDGNLYWKRYRNNNAKAGDKVGYYMGADKKYLATKFEGEFVFVHRLIYLMHHGIFPDEVNFIDGNSHNTRIDNLRSMTRSETTFSSRKRKDNTSGYKGVSFDNTKSKWQAVITKNRKRTFIGYFDDKESAYEAYLEMAYALWGDLASKHVNA